uniref:Coiled-coil domain containing 146 n=1 Tax=Ficedula albicollis TaxID=59894 RepID=A0A803V0L0_FICAL
MSQADEEGPTDTELAAENESPPRVLTPTAPSQEEGPTPTAPSQEEGPTPTAPSQEEGPTPTAPSQEEGPTPTAPSQEEGPTPTAPSQEEGPTPTSPSHEEGPTPTAPSQEEEPTPTSPSQEEGPTDITASPAFQCLDELFSAGKITDARVAELKEQYILLHEAVISLQESETQLLQEAERLSAELEQQCELEKAEQFPEEASSEASQIRQQLLSCRSEYSAVKGRVYENRLKIECLREEKKLLENEYEKISKEKKDNKIKRLKENCDELSKEVIQRKAEIDSMKEAVSSKEKMILTDEEEMEKLQEMQTFLKEMISDMDARVLEECLAAEHLLFKEQEKCRNELSTLTQLACLRADERQLKCRNVQKAKIQLQSIVKELKRKDRELIICKKMKKEMQKELQGFARMFDFMQIEKEKCMQLMRIAQWKARETENRVKLLENNIENLRNAVITRESGLLLREREEELGFLYERINRQEVLCRNGDIKMQVMDEKISCLKLKVAEKKREIKLCFEELTVKNALDAQLGRLQTQYSQCRDKIKQLEENHGDATDESRKQEMGGKDPSPPELLKRIEQMEAELVLKEQRLLKIDFLCENISDLTDRIRAVVENGKQDTLQFARRTNELQKKINDKTQEIRALFAEISMKQALVIKLQQEIRDKEQFVMTASLMISQGLPFPKEAEKEQWKILHNEMMQKAAAEARAKHPAEEEQDAVPGHASTSPKEERLPPLQPHMAPFRPSELSSSLRHFKKPPAKPSEI